MSAFFDAVGDFFGNLASIQWGALVLGLASFIVYLSIRARAYFHVLRAAYPDERFEFRRIWGAYMAAYGFNNVVPARGGDVVKLFLTKTSIPRSSYPAVGASFFVEAIFDLCMAIPIMAFAFTQGAFPKPPDFSKLPAFDIAFLASHPRFTLFLLTLLAILALVGFAVLSARVRAFWARVRQGLAILRDRRRYLREVFLVQLGAWVFRFTAFWFLLEAFNVGGSVTNVLLVLGVNAVAALVPFTPGGAGVQQALLVKVFAGTVSGATVAAYSVGQQIAIAVVSFAVGFAALVFIFRFRSFKEVIAAGREARGAEAGLGQSLARLADQGDGLGEDRGHHGADLLRLLLGRPLDVDPVDRGHGHVDRELDRVVGPGERLRALHLLGHLLHPALEVRVVEEVAEALHQCSPRSWKKKSGITARVTRSESCAASSGSPVRDAMSSSVTIPVSRSSSTITSRRTAWRTISSAASSTCISGRAVITGEEAWSAAWSP